MVQPATNWNDFPWFTQVYIPKQTIPILRIFAEILQAQTSQYIPWKAGERKQLGVDRVVAAFTQMKNNNQLDLYIATRLQCETRGQPVYVHRYQHAPQPAPTFGGAPMSPVYARPVPPAAGSSGWNRTEATSTAYTRPGPTLVDWKSSPMWKPVTAISNMEMLPDFLPSENSHTRKERKITFSLSADICEKMLQTKNTPSATPAYSIRLFCSSSDHFRPQNERITTLNSHVNNKSIPIEYPTQPDIRVDDLAITFKERGLRGKAGSAPPFDLNKSSRGLTLVPARLASVTFGHTGATTGKKKDIIKKFYFQIVLVEWTSKEVLQKKLADMPPTPIDQCLEIVRRSRDADDDIEVGSSSMSLKDPLSCMRITRPIRSAKCSHQQCFDATWWIESNAMHPQWLCPFCNKELHFSDLIVDGFFLSILQAVPESVEEVILEPDGEWHTEDDKFASAAWLAAHPTVQVAETKPVVKANGFGARRLSSSPPPEVDKGKRKAIEILSSDEEDAPLSRPSNAPSLRASRQTSLGRSSSSRPSAAPPSNGVIDLTLSDSDDDDAVPPPRPNPRKLIDRISAPAERNGFARNGDGAVGFGAAAAALQVAQDGPSMGAYRGDDLFDEDWDDGPGTGMGSLYRAPVPPYNPRPLSETPEPETADRPQTPPVVPSPNIRIPSLPTASGSSRTAFGLPASSDTYRPALSRPLPTLQAVPRATIPLPPKPPVPPLETWPRASVPSTSAAPLRRPGFDTLGGT